MTVIQSTYDADLDSLFSREEFHIEKRFNRICLWSAILFLLFSLILTFITDSDFSNPNVISNIAGLIVFLGYTLLTRMLLNRGIYNRLQKYATIFFTISVISIIVAGYVQGVDYVHATRTITLTAYFIAIIASGLYQNPTLPLFAAALACIEYSLLFFSAVFNGFPVHWKMETFRENILTFDILVVNLIFYMAAGIMVHFTARRHRSLMKQRRDSVRQLIRATEDRNKSEKKAAYYEKYDELTGLPNQKQFRLDLDKHITMAKARDRVFAVMCLGLDAFLHVNQLYGMDTGNIVLKEVGARLQKLYRNDDICCRFMGDSFLVLFADVRSSDSVSDLIKKTQNAFNDPVTANGQTIRVSASGGIVIFPNDGSTPDELVEKSESAMYSAKLLGKNQFRLYDEGRQQQLEDRIKIEKELSGALENGEFRVVYQPKVDSQDKVVGAEALLRWDNQTLGPVRPDNFIPIAEKSDIIVPIGLHVFTECCLHAVRWAAEGMDEIRISINVSAVQFSRRDFTDSIRKIIDQTGADPKWLGIEITETGIMSNEADCIEKLKTIKDMGLTVSIDDFGIGYSSLKRLGDYPLDTLKIDKSFVDGLPGSTTSVTIVQAIVDLAHNLGYSVVAEGVETAEQRNFLQSLGCEKFQGYFYYKPLTVEDFAQMLIRK